MVQKAKPLVREGGQELRRLIYRTLAPEPEIARNVANAFRSMLLIAPMNRGKTSWAEAIVGETIQHLVEQGSLDEQEIAYVYAEAVDIDKIIGEIGSTIDLNKLTYLFIFSDDAAASPSQHGRRAQSKGNVEVSKFYIRIRHILRRAYGYENALTAIHATQVYHLIDKTFREASDIDVLKALPKSQLDRRQIASLIHPEYTASVFGFLRALGRKRLLARNLNEFLEAIYTAIVLLDGVPFIVKAYRDPARIQEEVEERKAWLKRVQYLKLDPEDDTGGYAKCKNARNTIIDWEEIETIEEAIHSITRILANAKVISRGANATLKIEAPVQIHITKKYLEALERLGVQIPWASRT